MLAQEDASFLLTAPQFHALIYLGPNWKIPAPFLALSSCSNYLVLGGHHQLSFSCMVFQTYRVLYRQMTFHFCLLLRFLAVLGYAGAGGTRFYAQLSG